MLRRILVLALIFQFGELRNMKQFGSEPIRGPLYTFAQAHTYFIKLPFLSMIAQQRNRSSDKPNVDQRIDYNQNPENQQNSNQALTFSSDTYFVNKDGQQQQSQQQGSQQPQQRPQSQQQRPQTQQSSFASQQQGQQQPQQNQYPQQTQTQQSSFAVQQQGQQQPQQNQYQQQTQTQQSSFANQQQGQQQTQPSNYPQSIQSQQSSFGNQNQVNSYNNERVTTYRPSINFDRNSMVTSEESTQKTDQRPNSDSFGDQNNNNNKYNQDETSSTYPNENAGFSQNQIPPNKKPLEHKPDENAIIIPNMPSNVVQIIFPPTLSYDEDASTTTRASIFDSSRRRSTTTENYYQPIVS